MTAVNHPRHNDRREAARAVARLWAQNGVPAFPVRIGHDPTLYDGAGGTTKRPATINGHLAATTNLDELDRLFDRATCAPGEVFGAAILPGGGQYVVVDIDLKGGKNGFPAATNLDLLDTWGALTPSGGQHRIFRRPTGVRITNASPWAADGIDIRGDDGWIVAPGTDTPWGKWRKIDDERKWPDDVADLPADVLERLTTTTSTAGHTVWNRLNEDNTAKLDPATRRAVDALVATGGHSPILREREGREPWVEITRPGKRDGNSASVGYIGPGIVRSFTPNWPGVPEGRNEIADDGQIVPAGTRFDEWAARVTSPPPHVDPDTGEMFSETEPDANAEIIAHVSQFEIDWATFWDEDHAEEWLVPGFLAEGRQHAIFAKGGAGKSLFTLWHATRLAIAGTSVLYCDYEMTRADLDSRLDAMGYGPDTDLSALHYLSLPSIPPLDTVKGAEVLTVYARHVDAKLLVIDTAARAVKGEENDADTYRDLYRWTGLANKQDGRTMLRIDHAGHNDTGSARGSSAKNDDVDVVWELRSRDNGIELRARKKRMGWIPDKVPWVQTADPLGYATTAVAGWPEHTSEVAAKLDELGVPLDATFSAARAALIKAKYERRRKALVLSALKLRRQRAQHEWPKA